MPTSNTPAGTASRAARTIVAAVDHAIAYGGDVDDMLARIVARTAAATGIRPARLLALIAARMGVALDHDRNHKSKS